MHLFIDSPTVEPLVLKGKQLRIPVLLVAALFIIAAKFSLRSILVKNLVLLVALLPINAMPDMSTRPSTAEDRPAIPLRVLAIALHTFSGTRPATILQAVLCRLLVPLCRLNMTLFMFLLSNVAIREWNRLGAPLQKVAIPIQLTLPTAPSLIDCIAHRQVDKLKVAASLLCPMSSSIPLVAPSCRRNAPGATLVGDLLLIVIIILFIPILVPLVVELIRIPYIATRFVVLRKTLIFILPVPLDRCCRLLIHVRGAKQVVQGLPRLQTHFRATFRCSPLLLKLVQQL